MVVVVTPVSQTAVTHSHILVYVTVDTCYNEMATFVVQVVCCYNSLLILIDLWQLDPEPSLLFSYVNGLAVLDTYTRTVTAIIISDVAVEAFDYHYGYQVW